MNEISKLVGQEELWTGKEYVIMAVDCVEDMRSNGSLALLTYQLSG